MTVSIPIFDDDVNEAEEQIFVIQLQLVSAVNKERITFTRQASLCRIVDNDGKNRNIHIQIEYVIVIFNRVLLYASLQQSELDLNSDLTHTWNQSLKKLSMQALLQHRQSLTAPFSL